MLLLLAALLADPAPADRHDRPAVTIRLVRPRDQGERLLALFEGARAPNPAAALAGYRRAKGGDSGLGKGVEAAIASLNPGMIAELATLDDSTIEIAPSRDGRPVWDVIVPRDDGTFAAYATAAVLTDGAADPPLGGLPVDRLGPKTTASLAARAPGGFLLASDRPALAAALRRSREPLPKPEIDSGWLVHLDPKRLASGDGPLTARRVGVGLTKMGSEGVDASIRLDGDALLAELVGRYSATPPVGRATIPPSWLDAVPAGDALAVFAVALDPSPEAWVATFDLLDAVDRADPARANLAPLRLRLNLLAGLANVKPEADLWPLLAGVSAIVTADPSGRVDGALVRLHAKDEAAAERLRTHTIPRIVRSLGGFEAMAPALPPVKINDRPVEFERRGTDVAITWGRPIPARPAEVAGASPLRDALGAKAQRFAAFWPGRLPALGLRDAPPAVWVGTFEGLNSVDTIRWPGLKAVVRRALDRMPFDPPPDAATSPLDRR